LLCVHISNTIKSIKKYQVSNNGSFALTKLDNGLINPDKHKIIVSSHPSGLSNTKYLRSKISNQIYSPFNNLDVFGLINQYLSLYNKTNIIWITQ